MKLSKEQIMAGRKDDDGLIFTFYYRKVSAIFTKLFCQTSLTPNQISTMGLTVGLMAAIFFSFGEYTYVLIAGLLTQFSMFIDCADGEVARIKKMTSEIGGWMDNIFDKIRDNSIVMGIFIGQYFRTGEIGIIFLGLAALFAINMAAFVNIINMLSLKESSLRNSAPLQKIKGRLKIKLGYLTIGGDFQFLIYAIGAIFNKMILVLWLLAIFQNLYWIAMALYTFIYNRNKNNAR